MPQTFPKWATVAEMLERNWFVSWDEAGEGASSRE